MTTPRLQTDSDIAIIHPAGEETLYTLHVCQSFTRGIKESGIFTYKLEKETYLKVNWKNEIGQDFGTVLMVEFTHPEVKKSTILKKLAENLLEKLRENVIEALHRQFKGNLVFVGFNGHLVFEFTHDNYQSAETMEKKGNLEGVLLDLFAPMKNIKISFNITDRKQNKKGLKSDPKGDTEGDIHQTSSFRPDKDTKDNLSFKPDTDDDVSGKRQTVAVNVKSQSTKALKKEGDVKQIMDSGKRTTVTEKNHIGAESLLQNLHVCGPGGHSQRVKRLIEKVAIALEQESPMPMKAKGLDTVLCLDASDSIGSEHLQVMKEKVKEFIDNIESTATGDDPLEENIAVVVMGEDSRVLKQLTNDHTILRDAVDSISVGGRSPMMEALLMCIAAIKEKGGTIVVQNHHILPRIIFFTDGLCNSDEVTSGLDAVDANSKTEIIGLLTSMSGSEKDIAPLTWVPVGTNPDKKFLDSLAKLGYGMVVELEDIETLSDHYRIQTLIANVHAMMVNSKLNASSDFDIDSLTEALEGDLVKYHSTVVDAVTRKLDYVDVPDPDSQPSEYSNVHEVSHPDILPLGTRVQRGPHWTFGEQDLWGPGTVINHGNDKGKLWVHWDYNSSNCRYSYSEHKRDVEAIEQPRRLDKDEYIEIGVGVVRGVDWPKGQGLDGGEGNEGIVIRKNTEGMVKVKWLETQVIEAYKYGCNGLFEVAVSEVGDITEHQNTTTQSHGVWMWKDRSGVWQRFEKVVSEKIDNEYRKGQARTCLVTMREKGAVRLTFKRMSAKTISGDESFEVQRKDMSED